MLCRSILLAAVLCTVCARVVSADEPRIDFQRDVRPLLSDRCFACHGPDENHREADLRLDVRAEALDALSPDSLQDSEVLERILSEDPDVQMPPPESGKSLNARERQLLRAWIGQGAEYAPFWAYRKPQPSKTPKVSDPAWARNWIDAYVLEGMEREGLRPNPVADDVTLVRRLYFDLTGLPPAPHDVTAYLADASNPKRYEQLVDRLLQSPAYGQRVAMYWLDLVRYANTVGYHGDQDHNIAPYRDWVIDAFNANMPLDEFTRKQLAGDLLPGADIADKIASGYNRLLQTSHEGGVQPKEYLAIYAADRVRNVSAVWMGATLGCAQCHDHKYDPYTAKDFYAMAAFFADIDEEQHFKRGTNRLPTARPPEIQVWSRLQQQDLDLLQNELADLKDRVAAAESDGPEQAALKQQQARCEKKIEAIKKAGRWTMITVAKQEPRVTRILPRGNWLDDSGEIVAPAPPEFLGGAPALSAKGRPTRLDLADWLVDAEHGSGLLTARVFANRWWAMMFGEGLSRVLDDFGGQGQPPTHPELLDRLAIEFVESGWDVRHMLRLIVTSATYRQSSTVDQAKLAQDTLNQWFARQNRFRLQAEMIRDNALRISGLLVEDFGGAVAKPYQPTGYYRHLNFPPRKYKSDGDARQFRRGVYVHWQRQFLHPMFKAMDAPTREECTAQRPRSNTPLAALVLLNDPTFIESARAFADRILSEGGGADQERLALAFQHVLSRPPAPDELTILQGLLQESRRSFGDAPDAAAKLLNVGVARSAPAATDRERAAWTMVARTLLNLAEATTRN